MSFLVIRHGDGINARPEEIVAFRFRLIDSRDSIWMDTFSEAFPRITKIADSTQIDKERGIDQLLRMSSHGDSITIQLSVAQYFKQIVNQPVPASMDTSMSLLYAIRIDSVLSYRNYRKWIQSVQLELKSKQLVIDTEKIDKYLLANGIKALKSDTGIQYVISKEGKGEFVQSNQTVWVNYRGYLLGGATFATSDVRIAKEEGIFDERLLYKPKEVVVDRSSVIPGWHIALKLLRNGGRGTFFMPSVLCYGSEKLDTLIRENEILIFDIEVTKIE